MKAKVLLFAVFSSFICLLPQSYAGEAEYSGTPQFSYVRGGTHWVRSHFRKNGAFVRGHRAGNPGSGIHYRSRLLLGWYKFYLLFGLLQHG